MKKLMVHENDNYLKHFSDRCRDAGMYLFIFILGAVVFYRDIRDVSSVREFTWKALLTVAALGVIVYLVSKARYWTMHR